MQLECWCSLLKCFEIRWPRNRILCSWDSYAADLGVSKYDEIACFWICCGTSTVITWAPSRWKYPDLGVSNYLLGYRRSWLYGIWAWFKQCDFCNSVFRHPQLAIPQETHTSGLQNRKHFRVFNSPCVHIVRTWAALSKFIFGYISSTREDSTNWEAHCYFWSEDFLEGGPCLLSGIPVRIGSSFDQTKYLTFCLSYFRIVT